MKNNILIIMALVAAFLAGWEADHNINPRFIVYYEPLWPGTKLPEDTIYRSFSYENGYLPFGYEENLEWLEFDETIKNISENYSK